MSTFATAKTLSAEVGPGEQQMARLVDAASQLMSWYRGQKHELPWRRPNRDAYSVWVAEMMLQQTQVATVVPFYESWMRRFPTLAALADAPLEDVCRAWQGLGYYSRARNMHAAAQTIMQKRDGRFPTSVSELLSLPGVGPYTAAAIACIAFNRPEPPVDTNTLRVIARLAGITLSNRTSGEGRRQVEHVWKSMAPSGAASEFAEAVMDLGRLFCVAKDPNCDGCPVSPHCVAKQAGTIADCTPKLRRVERVRELHGAVVVYDKGETLVRRRREGELWAGLYEFPRGRVADPLRLEQEMLDLARSLTGERSIRLVSLPSIRHSVTRYSVVLNGFVCLPQGASSVRGFGDAEWVTWRRALELPMSAAQARLRLLADEFLTATGAQGEGLIG